MKSPSPKGKQKRAGKAPKARLYWMHREVFPLELTEKQTEEDEYPVAVLPTETAKQAKALVAFANLSEGEKRFALAKAIAASLMGLPSLSPAGFRGLKPSRIIQACNCADAILQATGHITGRDK